MTEERFRHDPVAHAIQRGRVWVSQLDERNTVHFAGVDHLELSVADARKLRDWLTSVLPVECPQGSVDVDTLDRHLAFLNNEAGRLRRRNEKWAHGTAQRIEAVAETIRLVRQERQMTEIGCRKIE